MEKLPARVSIFLGLFSGAAICAAWLTTRPHEPLVAISIGAAICVSILAVFRIDLTFTQRGRRYTDNPVAVPTNPENA